jgi:molecular chaperone IbpA
MTNTLTLRSLDIPSIHKFAVGFDQMFDELLRQTAGSNTANYPPYNVVKHSEDKFSIELAVAGFKEGDIEITVEKNQLHVKGEKAIELTTNVEYLHRGISSRNFYRNWTLADHVEVVGATVQDGILTVQLERLIPEEQKPKKIAICYNK